MPELIEGNYAGEFVVSEANGSLSRDKVTVKTGQDLAPGTVVAQLDVDTVGAVTADGGNTGDGAPGAVTLGSKVEVGIYVLTCVTASANAGDFEVSTPDGVQLADELTVGVAYATDHLNLIIADGAADFVVGDKFTVDISGSDKYVQMVLDAVDGSGKAAGVLYDTVDATAADKVGVIIDRLAEVNGAEIVWPAGITQGQQDAALADLLARNIKVR